MQSIKNALTLVLCSVFIISCNQEQNAPSPKVNDDGFQLQKDGPAKYADYHRDIRTTVGQDFPNYKVGDVYREYQKALKNAPIKKAVDLDFVERGPANAGGRTRGVLVDTSDPDRLSWFVASVGGGVWKTEDGGDSWVQKTPDIANLGTSTIANSASNPSKIYVGTGEGFGNLDAITGNGMWVSEDNGETWEILPATSNDFQFSNIDRIIVDPEDSNTLLICSTSRRNGSASSYIMKSVDGGATWDRTFSSGNGRIQQLVYSPSNFDTLYASINSNGVFRSIDRGEKWEQVVDTDPWNVSRIEMAIAPNDPNRIYLSCYTSGMFGSRLLFTRDAFDSLEVALFTPDQPNWMASQGWYDNTIAVHPYDKNKVWVAGQRPFLELEVTDQADSLRFLNEVTESSSYLVEIEDSGVVEEPYGEFTPLAQDFGYDTEITTNDIERVRITSGNGRTQMAHLIEVDFFSQEVSFSKMIEVPFEVKDSENDQIAVSVFDINGDEKWTLEDYSGQQDVIHDLIITNNVPYSIEGDSIIKNINPMYKGQYYVAYGLDPSYTGDVEDLPTGRINFTIIDEKGTKSNIIPVADPSGQWSDIKDVGSKGIHVDHHNIVFIPRDSATQSFYVLNANDGGLAFSFDNGENFRQTGDTFDPDSVSPSSDGYNVTQFYGIDKRNGAMQFVGGTQDNGSWVSPEDPEADSKWVTAPSGDGFEAAWNYADVNQVLETSQFNGLWKSYDGGESWNRIRLNSMGLGVGPFVTRLASSQLDPDLVLMNSDLSSGEISGDNIIRSKDFGETWEIIDMPERFGFNNGGAPIKVSLVDPNIIWTGGIMQRSNSGSDEPRSVCVSTDNGVSFEPTSIYTAAELGTISGINVHPENPNSAFVTFSQADSPKILKTNNLGETWKDITGFFNNALESSNGFPDVATYCVLVMPWDTMQIWAGTDIGIIESLDGGNTWAIADNGFPAVAIWDMRLVNDEIVFATHGRGIWTLNVTDLISSNKNFDNSGIKGLTAFPNPASDQINLKISVEQSTPIRVDLYGLDGQLIRHLLNDQEIIEEDIVHLNLPELVNGTYLLQIKTKTGIASKKILVYK